MCPLSESTATQRKQEILNNQILLWYSIILHDYTTFKTFWLQAVPAQELDHTSFNWSPVLDSARGDLQKIIWEEHRYVLVPEFRRQFSISWAMFAGWYHDVKWRICWMEQVYVVEIYLWNGTRYLNLMTVALKVFKLKISCFKCCLTLSCI